MDPMKVQDEIYNWRQNNRRYKGQIEIDPDRTRTDVALFNDAVTTFLASLRKSHSLRSIRPQELRCSQPSKWNHGLELIKNLNAVILRLSIINPKKITFWRFKHLILIADEKRWNDWSNFIR